MMNVEKTNGKYVVTANADVFIVPNRFNYIDLEHNFAIKKAKRICKTVNKEFYADDLFGEFWFVSNDLESDNIVDHGFEIEHRVYVMPYKISSLLPVDLFENLKEGESKEIVINVSANDYKNHIKDIPVELHLNITAKQKEYRYSNHGNFEDVYKRLVG